MENDAELPDVSEGESSIPDRRYYRIGEVSRITGVKAYVLRYWESE
ncbi:MAG: MerR family transcriptional regulator, partial [Candidatus Binatia bacterium]